MESINHKFKDIDCEIVIGHELEADRKRVYVFLNTNRGKWLSELECSLELIEKEPNFRDYVCSEAYYHYIKRTGNEPVPRP